MRAKSERLSQRQLNRAVLARQLLLERAELAIPDALERIGGVQNQYAPNAYIRLWSCLAGFRRAELDAALERREVIHATLLRQTIHLVSRADYWPLEIAVRRYRREWFARVQAPVIGQGQRLWVSTGAPVNLDGIRWNILGQTYIPKQLSENCFTWHASFPAEAFVPPHVHPHQDEFIYMLQGRLDFMLDGADAQGVARLSLQAGANGDAFRERDLVLRAVEAEDPGALKIYRFEDGQLSPLADLPVGGRKGLGYGPRHVDFHPTKPWMYVSVESQNQLHMHRVEGDEANAGYWYRRAGRSHSSRPLQEEWDEIAGALLAP